MVVERIAMVVERIATRRVRLNSMIGKTSVVLQVIRGIKSWEKLGWNSSCVLRPTPFKFFLYIYYYRALRFERMKRRPCLVC